MSGGVPWFAPLHSRQFVSDRLHLIKLVWRRFRLFHVFKLLDVPLGGSSGRWFIQRVSKKTVSGLQSAWSREASKQGVTFAKGF